MKITMLLVVSAALVMIGSTASWSQEDDATKQAIAQVRKAAGKVTVDGDKPGQPVVAVDI